MAESIEDLMAEIESRLKAIESSLPTRVNAMEISRTSKLPFKALTYREALIWRMAELSRGAFESFAGDKLAAAILLTRAAVETCAALWYLCSKIESELRENAVGDIDDFLMRLVFGSRAESDFPQAINVLNFVDRVEKEIPGFRHQYNILSEYSNPNGAGTPHLYSKFDHENRSAELGSHGLDNESSKQIGVLNLSVALAMFKHSYNRITEILPAFTKLCEDHLVAKRDAESG